MGRGTLPGVLGYLRQLAGQRTEGPSSDRQLLERFATRRDEAAFAALLERHGPMVWGVCLRVLGNAEDAEDAFQATFLVLARKAGAVGWRESVAGWLHTVARRAAWKARSAVVVPPIGPREDAVMPDADPLTQAARQELRAVLDEELARLPEKYRAPLVLCYLEGRTNEEAAGQLGWTKGTVSGRLSRARDLLRRRLARRGLALSAAALAGTVPATAAVPVPLIALTLKAAVLDGTAAAISGKVVTLAEGVLKSMTVSRWKITLLVLFLAGLISVGAVVLAYHPWTEAEPEEKPKQEVVQKAEVPPVAEPGKGAVELRFVQATVTLHLGRDGAPGEAAAELNRVIQDQATLAQLAAYFPDLGWGKQPTFPGGLPRVTVEFRNSKGVTATVHSTWNDWNDGEGKRKVHGNLMKQVGTLFDVARLSDQGTLLDSWQVTAFEEGGKKRDIGKNELYVTDTTFAYQISTYTRFGFQFSGRVEYQSPREYSVNPNKNPKEINLYHGSKAKPSQLGIYIIEGDTLKICFDKSGKGRPVEFKTRPGNADEFLLTLQRSPTVVKTP